jgi:hypothetical protein
MCAGNQNRIFAGEGNRDFKALQPETLHPETPV